MWYVALILLFIPGGKIYEFKTLSAVWYVLREISVLTEPALGHLRYRLTDVPPQPNSPPDTVFDSDRPRRGGLEVQKVGREARFRLIE